MSENNYGQDLAFLRERTEVVELSAAAGASVAVVPGFQGRVMTSAPTGPDGPSFGWINAKFIAAGREDPAFNNYGGEDRFWLGPEAGQFGLWFTAGEPFDTHHWKTPPGFGAGAFAVTDCTAESVRMGAEFRVANYSGTQFDCAVSRTINALSAVRVGELLGKALGDEVSLVAFESVNVLTNTGEAPWTRASGLLSIWILGMLKPLARGRVIVPFRPGDEGELGPRATTDYFGPIPPERCRVGDDHLLFVCDGAMRNKLGVSPQRARNILGSYDPDASVLTLVQFTLPDRAAELAYVNSLWEIQDAPYAGDAVNSYNDGEPEPGAGQMGPFYEVETSSPAAELAPGESITHIHRTCHLTGPFDALNPLSRALLGVDLSEC